MGTAIDLPTWIYAAAALPLLLVPAGVCWAVLRALLPRRA